MRSRFFSIIELMTVILIILLLISLFMPTFTRLKVNANTTVCKSQLRQIGIFIAQYVADNAGYLPNDDYYNRTTAPYPIVKSDLGNEGGSNTRFYAYWQGHLSPYLSLKLPEGYKRSASGKIVPKDGGFIVEVQPVPVPAKNVYKDGWVIIEEAITKGGHDDYKTFICPETHLSTVDVNLMLTRNNLRVPRILGVLDKPGPGFPTTYLANSVYFGKNGYYDAKVDSMRIDDIDNVGNKILLVEGGTADPSDHCSSPYYFLNNYFASNPGGLCSNFDSTIIPFQKLNFTHDLQDEFWVLGTAWTDPWTSRNHLVFGRSMPGELKELAAKFTDYYSGKAMMAIGATDTHGGMGYSLISYVDPLGGSKYGTFFATNHYLRNGTKSYLSPNGTWEAYVNGKETDFNYLVGKMNVLLGDGSVLTKDNAWVCNNRQQMADSPD